ncbi:MAG: TlpA family protein disulfide reductase [Lentimicrobium sp.]|jgi:peroxiredoxin|nr:TlpA family protein disulfide reductase [Lentimicrobium sp.]
MTLSHPCLFPSARKAKIKRTLVLLLFLAGLAPACDTNRNPETTAVISLSCPEDCRFKVSLSRLDTNSVVPIDSLMMKPGKTARFRLNMQNPGFYLLNFETSRKILVLHPGDSIKASLSPEGSAVFTGGAENAEYQHFVLQLDAIKLKIDSLFLSLESAKYTDNYGRELKYFDSTVSGLSEKVKKIAIQYLQQHPTALSQVLIMNAMPGNQAVFKGLADSTWYFYSDSTLGVHFPENPHRLMHHHRVQRLRRLSRTEAEARTQLKTGSQAPDIKLPDFSDRLKSWHHLKGKPILLYFWAPTDAQSRQSNLKLKQIIDRDDSPEFQVYAVAFDTFPDRWKAAVNLDKLWWTNVIDTLGNQSLLHVKYRIERLPVLILLDKEGRILHRFVSVDALEEYLKKNKL